MQILEFSGRDENIENFCPFCGENNSGQGDVSECEHLLFVYHNEVSFIYLRDDINKLVPNLQIVDEVSDETRLDKILKLRIPGAFAFSENNSSTLEHFMIAYGYPEQD